MIPSGVRVCLALETIDLRGSFGRLCGAALEQVGYDARGGALLSEGIDNAATDLTLRARRSQLPRACPAPL